MWPYIFGKPPVWSVMGFQCEQDYINYENGQGFFEFMNEYLPPHARSEN